MPEMNGSDVLLKVGGFIVGSQRGVTFQEQNATIDFSSKEQRHGKFDYGRYTSTCSLEMLYVPDTSGYNALKNACRNGDLITVIRRELGIDEQSAPAVVTSMSEDFPDQGEATIAVDLQIADVWTVL